MISSKNYELVKWFDIDLVIAYINFIFFWHFGCDLNMERWKGNLRELAAKGGWKGSRKGGVEWHNMSYSMPFSFWVIKHLV